MLTRRLLPLLLAVMLMMIAVPAVFAGAEPPPNEAARTVADRHGGDLKAFARLQIGERSELLFYEMMTERGSSKGVGMASFIPAGGLDPTSVRALHGANPHEIFYALSERGTEIPGVLREYHENRFEKQGQGWALEKIKPGVYNLFSCQMTGPIVANAVAATGLPYSYNELSKGPHNGPFWYVEDPNALFPTYYQNNGVVTVGDAYYYVMLCDEDPAFSFTSVGVRLAYTETSDYEELSSGELYWQLHNPGDQMSFMSWPFDSDLSGDNSWFWMLTVEDVFYQDTLHIGTAWS